MLCAQIVESLSQDPSLPAAWKHLHDSVGTASNFGLLPTKYLSGRQTHVRDPKRVHCRGMNVVSQGVMTKEHMQISHQPKGVPHEREREAASAVPALDNASLSEPRPLL